MPVRRRFLVAASLALCSGVGTADTRTSRMTSSPPRGELPVSLDDLVQAALSDAARVSGRPREALVVIDAEEVTWPDGAGGCPEPGVGYIQVLVPGYRIRIRSGKQVLNYHATRSSKVPVLCPADRVQPALPPQGGLK